MQILQDDLYGWTVNIILRKYKVIFQLHNFQRTGTYTKQQHCLNAWKVENEGICYCQKTFYSILTTYLIPQFWMRMWTKKIHTQLTQKKISQPLIARKIGFLLYWLNSPLTNCYANTNWKLRKLLEIWLVPLNISAHYLWANVYRCIWW